MRNIFLGSISMKGVINFKIMLLLIFIISSCNDKGYIISNGKFLSDSINNIYSTVNMSLFEGFENGTTINELINKHGKPDTIFMDKSNNYKIFEYNLTNGIVDCYNQKDCDIIDYIYYRPNNNININNFINNNNIAESFSSENKFFTLYLCDRFDNLLKINKRNNNTIEYIGLNDWTEFIKGTDFKEAIDTINYYMLPATISDLFQVLQIESDNKNLYVSCYINEPKTSNINEIFQSNKNLDICLTTLFFNLNGTIKYIIPQLSKNNMNVVMNFIGYPSNLNIHKTLNPQYIQSLISNKQILFSLILLDNISMLSTNNDSSAIKFEENKIEGNYLIMPMTIACDPNEINSQILATDFKDYISNSFLDPKNPEKIKLYYCYKSGLGIKYIYNITKLNKVQSATFNNNELKQILTKMRF